MHHFYVPRRKMPQVDEKDLPHLIAVAFDQGLTPTIEVVDPKELHAHQRVNHTLAQSMPIQLKLKPAVVSADGYVLDGNHRWWSHIHDADPAMNIIRIGLSFNKAIDWLFSLSFVYSITKETPVRN